jgi:hypothetical protein
MRIRTVSAHHLKTLVVGPVLLLRLGSRNWNLPSPDAV